MTLDFNPMVSPHREDPHLFYREARAHPPMINPVLGAYMVTRYDDLTTVIDDPETYSSAVAVPKIYWNPPEVTEVSQLRNSRHLAGARASEVYEWFSQISK